MVVLGDQPEVDPATIDRLLAAWRSGAPIAAVAHAGRLTHPVLFDRSLFGALRELSGDAGARGLLKARRDEVAQVEGRALRDLDTPADYEALVSGRPAPGDEGQGLA